MAIPMRHVYLLSGRRCPFNTLFFSSVMLILCMTHNNISKRILALSSKDFAAISKRLDSNSLEKNDIEAVSIFDAISDLLGRALLWRKVFENRFRIPEK